jgi:hypothetical protein
MLTCVYIRLSTRRTAWAKVEPKYNQPPEISETCDKEKENYTYMPQVNEVAPDMISVNLYLNDDVTNRLTRTTKGSKAPVQKPPQQQQPPSKERTIIDISSFLSGPAETEECLKSSSRDDGSPCVHVMSYHACMSCHVMSCHNLFVLDIYDNMT